MDPVQIVLLTVIVILTILLVILGIQVFLILKEIKSTLSKANKVIENAGSITEHIKDPLSALSSLTLGLKSGSLVTLIKLIRNLLGKSKETERE